MNGLPLIGAGIVVGGEGAWKPPRQKGDVCVAFHWINGEPAAVYYLHPRFAQFSIRKTVPYVMPLSVAHELVKEGGKAEVDSRVLIQKAALCATLMGRDGDFQIVRQIADLMLDSLDELLDMPPEPPAKKGRSGAPTGELAFKIGGDTIFEGEVP